jgi:hypothetical protein
MTCDLEKTVLLLLWIRLEVVGSDLVCRIFIRNKSFEICNAAFRIRMGFNPDPDLAFHLNADPDLDPGSQTKSGLCVNLINFLAPESGSESASVFQYGSGPRKAKSMRIRIRNTDAML